MKDRLNFLKANRNAVELFATSSSENPNTFIPKMSTPKIAVYSLPGKPTEPRLPILPRIPS